MSNSEILECGLMMDVLTGECTEGERLRFERHLPHCPSCRREWDELRSVWEELPMDMEEVDVPDDLKQQVMDSIFHPDREPDRSKYRIKPSRIPIHKRWRNPLIYAAMFGVLFLGLGLWLGGHYRDALFPDGQQPLREPMEAKQVFPIYSYSANMPDIKGNVTLASQGDARIVVIAINGLNPTAGDNVYQAWLIHGDKRYNCGTFKVNEDGQGLLTYQLTNPNFHFTGIGITLEPDPDGNRPRGVKVAGTKQT